jgi:hypothetical protein
MADKIMLAAQCSIWTVTLQSPENGTPIDGNSKTIKHTLSIPQSSMNDLSSPWSIAPSPYYGSLYRLWLQSSQADVKAGQSSNAKVTFIQRHFIF